MLASARAAASGSWPKCGCRREPGNRRTSASSRTSPAASNFKNSASGRVEWPAVQITRAACFVERATPHSSALLLLDYLDLQRIVDADLWLAFEQHHGAGDLDRFALV